MTFLKQSSLLYLSSFRDNESFVSAVEGFFVPSTCDNYSFRKNTTLVLNQCHNKDREIHIL